MSSLPCCLRQSEFGGKRVGFVCQNFQVIGSPGLEANLGQSCRVLRRFEQVLLLSCELLILAISNQRIRDIAESALDRLLVGQDHLVALRFSEANVRFESSSLKDGLRQRGSQVPDTGRAGEEICERWTFVAGSSGKRDLRKVRCPGNADLRVGGDQVRLGFADVRPPLQQRRGKPDRHFGSMRLFGQFQSSRNIAGVVAEKYADGVFLLSDLALEVRDFGCGGVYELLGLAHIQHRVDAVLLQSLGQLERVAARTQRALGNLQFEIELAKLKVGGCQVGDQSRRDFLLRPLVGQQIRSRRFRCAAVFSPEVQIPGCGRGDFSLRDLVGRNRPERGILHARDVAACAHGRKLVGARDSELRLSL